ncbi:MAG: hypothetical protein BWK73_22855 [Thiothrix lacustris]|uniref:Uncharacterized protein n=1 Tax=Thiothrix lacustris TaxID=525917 RepID=A0A1Y1QN39_9GAMM|nr:MAG: hypothetical protein BWK73_22855 [Thiothrix lacustris]
MDFFKNESEALTIGELSIENRLDRVSLYGSIDLTHDAEGLALALRLKGILDGVVSVLEGDKAAGVLPDKITVAATDDVENPFG